MVSFRWAKGKLTTAAVVSEQGEQVSSQVRQIVVNEAATPIAEGVKAANLDQASGYMKLYMFGKPPYLIKARALMITEPDLTVLNSAVERCDVAAVRQIVLKDRNANQRSSISGETALATAISARKPECARILLDLGADPNIANDIGTTPLMFAALTGDEAAVRMLIASGASITAKDSVGKTAADYAHLGRHEGIVPLLGVRPAASRE